MRVGIDLVSADTVRESIRAHGQRYLRRVYTERELADCTGPDGPDVERLAARFAAKEAVLKALRPCGEQAIPWLCIEVIRDPAGWVEVRLDGPATELAHRQGIGELALSFTHEDGHAAAVVVASENAPTQEFGAATDN